MSRGRNAAGSRQLFKPGYLAIADCGQTRQFREISDEVLAPVPAADDSYFWQHALHHEDTPLFESLVIREKVERHTVQDQFR